MKVYLSSYLDIKLPESAGRAHTSASAAQSLLCCKKIELVAPGLIAEISRNFQQSPPITLSYVASYQTAPGQGKYMSMSGFKYYPCTRQIFKIKAIAKTELH